MKYDDLIITFEHREHEGTQERYQVSVRHSALSSIGGPLRRSNDETFWASQVQDVRDEYTALIDVFHQLSMTTRIETLFELGCRVTEVLPERTQASLIEASMRARQHGHGLRITIAVHQNALALLSVPWELLVVPLSIDEQSQDNLDPLLLDHRFILVRQVVGVGRALPVSFEHPLRFQAFAAQPYGVGEVGAPPVEEALRKHAQDQTTFWYAGTGTLEQMQVRLLQHEPQILHILCHGSESSTHLQPRHDLLLTHTDGNIRRAGVFDLAPILALAPDLKLVILQACHGGAHEVDQERRASESIALGLLRRGIPTVIAFQGEVAQGPAAAFVDTFYGALAQGDSVEHAVALARPAMLTAGGMVDWSLPVLYQGHASADPRTPLTRIADGLEVGFENPRVTRWLRRGMVVLALGLIMAAFTRWLLFPDALLPQPLQQLRAIVALWIMMGLIGPAIVAVAYQGGYVALLPYMPRGRVIRAQWMGAYLGYGMGGMVGLILGSALYAIGLVSWLPEPVLVGLVLIVIGWSLLCSYTVARRQVQSALVLAGEFPEFFGVSMLGLILVVAFFLLFGVPYVLVELTNTVLPGFGHPAAVALVVAVLLLGWVLLPE